ncbi:sodium:solute symporter family protein [Bordetella genomosp. 11]|uniref:Cation acetate symporter n=1 Tax=Bordetella genomosp. 11 TaxID=1416808 RepID=A0A261UJ94_9BORD|nr:sodium:solute symporter family protein [Bordetella genomosp. 11]OZI61976.1 cation acetate symporter [Bordetella genomosp. 11]
MPFSGKSASELNLRLRRVYVLYAAGFGLLILVLALLEVLGMPRNWIGYIFLLVTFSLYAGIGIVCRTSDPAEYYVAGRRVPAFYNGMATAADWMSVASFIGVAGTLYASGYAGLAYVMGWTGGYVLVALLLAPYLRKFGQYTLPDFLGARYGGNLPRLAGVACAVLCSFTYLVAQIYGVGIITTRMTGISFELGIFLALGGMLVCSFLGGMRAVTWTQVGQFIILIIAYVVPVIWLSIKFTGMAVPQISAGVALEQVARQESRLLDDDAERAVRREWQARADRLDGLLRTLPGSWVAEKARLRDRLAQLNAADAPMLEIRSVERELDAYPSTVEEARTRWYRDRQEFRARAQPPVPAATPYPAVAGNGSPYGTAAPADSPSAAAPVPIDAGREAQGQGSQRANFLALVLCLMLGTAGLPHILMRSYTTPSVGAARRSVCWTLLFILLLYLLAPTLAILVKYVIYTHLVGARYSALPDWVAAWSAISPSLVDVVDVNGDGIVQLGEIHMGADVVVLALPEIGGLPYVVSGLVAAGGLAAALSTADGLLLTLSNALSHDMLYRVVSPRMPAARRVMVSKTLLLVVAFAAAWVAARRPADILIMVSAAFSVAASSFFPALVMGIFWKRANKWGATAGMAVGLAVTFGYMAHSHPWLRELVFGIPPTQPLALWWGIQPVAAGIFGAPAAFLTILIVSLLTPRPDPATEALVDYIRDPRPAAALDAPGASGPSAR